MVLSKFWGPPDRRAEVCKDEQGFYVQMFVDKQLVERRDLYQNSQGYAEDCAENFVMKWGEWKNAS